MTTPARRWIRRVKQHHILEHGIPTDGQPWVADWRSYDIPNTVAATIRNATSPHMVAISLSLLGGVEMIRAAEHAARERGIRILWWFGPGKDELSQAGRNRLLAAVKEARA